MRRRFEVDVWRLAWKVWRAIVLERKEVDSVVADLLWRHVGGIGGVDQWLICWYDGGRVE